MIALSEHFKQNWRRRIGNEPTVEMVQEIMQRSVIVQRARSLRTLDGRPFKTLGIYWAPDIGVVVSVDEFKGMAVSCLVGEKADNANGMGRR